jgi:signal transduction histidine kinase
MHAGHESLGPEETQEELDPLAYSVSALSHDIKNVLQILQVGASVIDEALRDGNLDSASRGWDIVKRKIRELALFTNDILYLGKKGGVRLKQVSPGEAVRQAVNSLRWKADLMGVRLAAEADPHLPPAMLDPETVPMMLGNLISNVLQSCRRARQAPPRTVFVRSGRHDRSCFRFEIEDHVAGMDAESTGPGMTPALLVAEKICTEHGGRMEVLTAPDRGTVFRVIMPYR